MSDPDALYGSIQAEIDQVLIGNDHVIEGLTIAALTGGHVLLEGVPGIAKTTMANLFARASGLEYARIQMTPDVLPADVTGTRVYRQGTGEFELRKGPIFANVVVADEINRATPKTQSALLEAMEEGQVTIDGETLSLPSPFLVIATQNPIEMEGTFQLPEAQRDRFQQKLTVEIPDRDDERLLLDQFDETPTLGAGSVSAVTDGSGLLDAGKQAATRHVAPSVKEYVLDLVAATRDHDDIKHGASPRASLAFLRAGKARAAIHGRGYVIPDDIKALATAILSHRLVLDADAELRGVEPPTVVADILDEIEPPSATTSFDATGEVATTDDT